MSAAAAPQRGADGQGMAPISNRGQLVYERTPVPFEGGGGERRRTPQYAFQTAGASGEVYSCDKLQLRYRFRRGDAQHLLDQIARQGWLPFEHWESLRMGTFRHQFRVLVGAQDSFWFGVGLNSYSTGRPGESAKLEFNPNKVGTSRQLLWLLRQVQLLALEWDIKQWDLACDYPVPRRDMVLVKDARLYEEYAHSADDRTQYIGQRNEPGRCKLYNKQLELKLPEPLTRLEMTIGGTAKVADIVEAWPKVYKMQDVQTSPEVAALNDTDRFILRTLMDSPERIKELSRRKRAKMAALLDGMQYEVRPDAAAIDRVARYAHSLPAEAATQYNPGALPGWPENAG